MIRNIENERIVYGGSFFIILKILIKLFANKKYSIPSKTKIKPMPKKSNLSISFQIVYLQKIFRKLVQEL